jgi:nucleoside-diphosphate-sugar epimerase
VTAELHLVTGGSGYFGSLLARKLREQGRRVRVFDRVDADDRPPDVEFVQGDIRDAAAVQRACHGATHIYHNVAQVPLAKDRHQFRSVNVLGTEILLAAARAAGTRKVVYTSSSAVYGVPERNPVTEEMEPHPKEAYGRAKLDGERACLRFARAGLDVSIIRPRTILGHGRLGIFQVLFEWVRQGANIPVLGSGANIYQFVHADDLAEACILAAGRPGSRVYHCGAERYGTMREVLEHLCAHAGTGSRVRSVPFWPAVVCMKVTALLGLSPLGPYHALMYGRSMYFDITRAKTELGWRPRFSNDEMFAASYDWYLAHREHVLGAQGASHHRSAVKQGILALIPKLL